LNGSTIENLCVGFRMPNAVRFTYLSGGHSPRHGFSELV
jgi:hypothetical protein